MNKTITNMFIFAVGAAVGSAVTWKVLKTKYDRLIQEEIDSVKEIFCAEYINDQDSAAEEDEQDEDEPDGNTAVVTEEYVNSGRITAHQVNWEELEDLDEEDDDDVEYDHDPDYLGAKYASIINDYTNKEGGVTELGTKPYVISPYDYGVLDDYHQIELTYYADEILEDSDGEIVKDPEEILGDYALRSWGDYEPDSVHVRNDMLRTDFEILRDPRTYDQARSIGPGMVDDE